MTSVCFNGCSFTVGEGFPVEQRDVYIYDRLISKTFNFDRTNIAVGGSSNYKIFLRSAAALSSGQFDIVFSQWSALNRVWFSPGPDSEFFLNDKKFPDFKYRNIYLSPQKKQEFQNTLLILNHDYQNLLDLVDYCNILDSLAKLNNVKSVYINGLLPWQTDLIAPLTNNFECLLSDYSKEILDFKNRDDKEISLFFTQLQEKIKLLNKKNWVNQFESMQFLSTDKGPEGHHPGIKSHQLMANLIESYLKNNIL
jgi:hypothetical protein